MNLTTAQKATLLADIQANTDTNTLYTEGNLDGLANLYNVTASPVYWVWRSFVPDREIYEKTTADGTTWSWSSYIGRNQAERDAWRQIVNMAGGFNASLANVRAGIADIFSGAGGAAQRTHLLTIGRREATRFEKLFAVGLGTTVSPSVLGLEGQVTYTDFISL